MNLVTFTPSYYPDPTKGKPLGGGFVYIGEPGTDPTVEVNQKTVSVLQENGNLVEVDQPITLNAGGSPTYNGSVVSVWVVGDYSSTVQDSTTAQFSYTPRTSAQAATGTQFPVWDIGTTYAQNAYVTGSDNRLYYSIAGANLGNDPTSTSGFWQGFVEVGDDITGDVTGNLTGNVTGNVEGDVLKVDGIAGRVLRLILVSISDGTNASTIKITVGDVWNGDAIAEVDNVAKGATTGGFTLDANGQVLIFPVTGDLIAALSGDLTKNGSTSELYPAVNISSLDMSLTMFVGGTATPADQTVLVDTGSGSYSVKVAYITNA